ncbi:unnamed protein product [Diatraea saccharalis]|uniref:Uncharacterized protein n=1 Tax=Diatraea saccharalis TaxID=40085 RepID=A0A9P0FYX2_9NEOP|nr:unnamed protein product [Diatraea saccharalis]
MLLPLFHISVVSFYVYSLWYDQQYLDLPLPAKGYEVMPYKGRLMFLTMWTFILQTIYFFVSFLNDLIGSNDASPKKRPLIRMFKDALFGLAFPMAIYVGISFWSIYHFDKELIFPEKIAKIFPPWLNHTYHSFIVLFIVLELIFTNKTYLSRKVGLVLAFTYFVSYLVWMHILFERTGVWPYPIFNVLNLPARLVFFAVSIAGGLYLYIVGEKLNSFVSTSCKKKVDVKQKRR